MKSTIFKFFENMCSKLNMSGSILEIGSGPNDETLLNLECVRESKSRMEINLIEYNHYKDFKVIKCNANDMSNLFKDGTFDVVLCNAVLEHDPFFWKTLSEIKRVLKDGGIFVIGVPGFIGNYYLCKETNNDLINKTIEINNWLPDATVTFKLHFAPGDYWRFSQQAFKEVLLEGFKDIHCYEVLIPPRLIGYGFKEKTLNNICIV